MVSEGEVFTVIDVWCRGEYDRDVAWRLRDRFFRKHVSTAREFRRVWWTFREVDFYAEVFSARQLRERRYDTVFMEVDAHDRPLEKAYELWRCLVRDLERVYGVVTRSYFSGRGFHVYADFREVQLVNYRVAVLQWGRGVRVCGGRRLVDVVDLNAFGRVRQLARVPYTVNTVVGLVAVPVVSDMSLREIVEASKEVAVVRTERVRNDALASELLEYDVVGDYVSTAVVDEEERRVLSKYFAEKRRSLEELPPCIRIMIEELIVTGELDHYHRLNVAAVLIPVWGIEETYRLFELFASDFNPWKTKYQLEYIARRELSPYKCRRIRDELGVCPYADQRKCPFYPWIELWLPRKEKKGGGSVGGEEQG